MSVASSAYKRLCALYRNVLVRMKLLNAQAEYGSLCQPASHAPSHALEPLEPRQLLSGGSTPTPATFAPKVDSVTGSNPFSVVSADFNKDGKQDLAVTNLSNAVSVLLGNGDGTFTPKNVYTTGSRTYCVTAADFNKDGKLDLAVTNEYSNTLSVLLGNGDGTFAPKVDYPLGPSPASVTSADFNKDGKVDLAVGNYLDNTISVLLGNGDGTFASQVPYFTSGAPQYITSGDFNGDGKIDLAATCSDIYAVSVLPGNGDGTFAPEAIYVTGSNPLGLTSADFNGDGRADLAVANYSDNTVSVFLAQGDGTFADKVDYAVEGGPCRLASADFNGDGKADLAVENRDSNTVSVLLNNGGGTFASAVSYVTGSYPQDVISADYNGDGKPDLVVANSNSGTVSVLLNTTNVAPVVTVDSLLTNNNKPTLTGTASPTVAGNTISSVTVKVDGQNLAATVKADGTWSVAVPVALLDGVYDVTATAVDNVGNVGTDSTTNELTVDTVAPVVTDVSVSKVMLADADAGSGMFTVTVSYSKAMNTSTSPVITFTPSVAGTLTFAGGTWTDSTHYQASYNVADAGVAISNVAITVSPTAVYNLTSDFSTVNNPNGVWSYNLGSTPITRKDSSSEIVGWSPESSFGRSVVQAITTPAGSFDWQAGDVAVHANSLAGDGATVFTNISWTAPAAGTIRISGRAWDALFYSDRDAGWSLLLNGSVIAQRNTIYGTHRTDAAAMFENNLLGGKSLTVTVAAGDVIDFSTLATTYYGHFIGVQMNIETLTGVQDLAGNVATVYTGGSSFGIDTQNPTAMVTPLVTNNSKPMLMGALSDGSFGSGIKSVQVAVGGQILTATVNPSWWNVIVPESLADGTYDVEVTAVDNAGNSTVVTGTAALTIDTIAPVVTVEPLTTNNHTPTLTGTVSDASPSSGISAVTVTVAGQTLQAALSNDMWSVAVPIALANGTYDVQVTAIDIAGNIGTDATTNELTIKTGQFAPSVAYATAYADVRIVDLNGDGKGDLVGRRYDSGGYIIVWMNNGDGTFASEQRYASVGSGWDSLTVADLNGDGRPDLAMTRLDSGNSVGYVGVLLNKGDGTFGDHVDYAIVGYDYTFNPNLFVADLNADGKLDLAVSTHYSGTSVLLNMGNGTFAPSVNYTLGGSNVHVVDLNEDGKADLVGIGYESVAGYVSIRLNNGNGTFGAEQRYATVSSGWDNLTVRDLNGDGRPDLAMARYDSGNSASYVDVLLNNGDGTFGDRVEYAIDDYNHIVTSDLVVADLNGDGRPDIVSLVDNHGGGTNAVNVLMNKGDGTFASKVVYTLGSSDVRVVDLNGDGKVDLVGLGDGLSNGYFYDYISVRLGNGDGTFGAEYRYATTGSSLTDLTIADLNGDGKPDLAMIRSDYLNPANYLSVLLNKGDGTFGDRVDYVIDNYNYTLSANLIVADLNADGKLDLIKPSGIGPHDANTVNVLLNITPSPTITVNPLVTNNTTPLLTGTVMPGVDGTYISSVTVTIAGQVVPASIMGNMWMAAVPSALSDGTYDVKVTAVDNELNGGSYTASGAITIDTVAPTVSVLLSPLQSDPTNSSTIYFTVIFSEPVTGFTAGSVILGGSTGANLVEVAPIASRPGGGGVSSVGDVIGSTFYTGYTVAVSGMTMDGIVTLAISSGAGIDAAGNTSQASAPVAASATYDATPPTMFIERVTPAFRTSSVDSITITFSEPVKGFALATLSLWRNGSGITLTDSQTLTTSDGGKTWTLGNLAGLTGVAGSYALSLNESASGITDLAGNSLGGHDMSVWTLTRTIGTAGVQGYVYDSVTEKPLGGVMVQVWQSGDPTKADKYAGQWVASAVTDSTGKYVISGLVGRTYMIGTADGEASGELHYLGATAQNVVVGDGQVVTQNLNLMQAASMYGYVKDSLGNPVKEACVYVDMSYTSGSDHDRHTTATDSSGRYTLYVAPSDRKVYPVSVEYAYNPGSQYEVYGSNSQLSSVDFNGDLTAQGFTYLGSASSSSMFAGGYSTYVLRGGVGCQTGVESLEGDTGNYTANILSMNGVQNVDGVLGASDESYAIVGTPGFFTNSRNWLVFSFAQKPQSALTVHVADLGLDVLPTFFGAKSGTLDYAADIGGTRGPDFSLDVGGMIHGKVANASGTGLPFGRVEAILANSSGQQRIGLVDGISSTGDYYIISVPQTSQFWLRMEGFSESYQGVQYASADDIYLAQYSMTAGMVLEAPAVTLAQAGRISGQVTDSHGAPIAGAKVILFGFGASGGRVEGGDTFTTATDAGGNYQLYAPAGQWALLAGAQGYSRAVTNSFMLESSLTVTRNITLTAEQTASVSGTVSNFASVAPVNQDGVVLPFNFNENQGSLMVIYSNPAKAWSSVEYLLPELRVGSTMVEDGYDDFFASNSSGGAFGMNLSSGLKAIQVMRQQYSSLGNEQRIMSDPAYLNLTGGQVLAAESLTYETGTASLSGQIYFTGGVSPLAAAGITNIWVMQPGTQTQDVVRAECDMLPDGRFAIDGLPAGTYYLKVASYGMQQFNSDAFTLSAGQAAEKYAQLSAVSDTQAPTVTVDSLATNSSKPTLTGTCSDSAGSGVATVSVKVGGQVMLAAVNYDGTWSVTLSEALADGTYDVQVTATDQAGNSGSDTTTNELVIDTVAPVVTVNSLNTSSATPTISGTVSDASPSSGISAVVVKVGGQTLIATVDSGAWSVTIPVELTGGTYDVQATATDMAGNNGSDTTVNELVIKLTYPAPTITVDSLVTQTSKPVITGTVTDHSGTGISGVSVKVGGQTISATVNADGTWNAAVPAALADGTYDVQASATDNDSKTGNDTTTGELVVDAVAPVVTVNALTTSSFMPMITGTVSDASPSSGISAVMVKIGSMTVPAFVNIDGTWSAYFSTMSDGVYDVQATATDMAGNSSSDTTTNELTIDTVAPTVSITPVSPGTRNTAVDSITITFSEKVTGFDLSDLSLTCNSSSVTLTESQTLASGDGGKTWTLGNLSGLTGAAGSYLLVLNGSTSGVQDQAGNPMSIGDSTSWTMVTDGYIYGYVKDSSGKAIKYAQVSVSAQASSSSNSHYSAMTDSSGMYQIYVPPASQKLYMVQVDYAYNPGSGYKVYGTNAAGTYAYDGDLVSQGFAYLGTASGTYTFAGGYKYYVLQGNFACEVAVDSLEGGTGGFNAAIQSTSNVQNYSLAQGVTDGSYALLGSEGVNPNLSYMAFSFAAAPTSMTVHAVSQGLAAAPTYYASQMATGYALAAMAGTHGQDFTMALGAAIHGRVTTPSGIGISDMSVDVVVPGAYSQMYLGGFTGTNGDYYILGVPANTNVWTKLSDRLVDSGGVKYAASDRYFGMFNVSAGTMAQASTVTATQAVLVSGVVKDSLGNPLSDVEVSIRGIGAAGGSIDSDNFRMLTDSSGNYQLYVPAGIVEVRATHQGFAAYCSPLFTVTAGQNVTQDVTLASVSNGVVMGTVTNFSAVAPVNQDGVVLPYNFDGRWQDVGKATNLKLVSINPSVSWTAVDYLLPGANIYQADVEDGYDEYFAANSSAGTYQISIPAGQTAVQILREGVSSLGNSQVVLGSPLFLNLGVDATLSGQDMAFTVGTATITGQITFPAGYTALSAAGATAVWVMQPGVGTQDVIRAEADMLPDGRFAINNLPAGTYYLKVVSNGLQQWNNAAFTLAAGQTLTVNPSLVAATDTQAPVVKVNSLVAKTAKPTITGTVTDAAPSSGVLGVMVSVGGQTLQATVSGTTWSVTLPAALSDGTYEVQAQARDAAGNSGFDSTSNELVIDTVAPVVTVTSQTTNYTKPVIAGTVSDASPSSGISSVKVTVNGQIITAYVTGNTWSASPTVALPSGLYNVSVTATDAAGNSGSDTTTNELLVDATAPTVTVNTLTTPNTMPTLTGTVNDASPSSGISGVKVTVNGSAYDAAVTGTIWSLAVPVALSVGKYNVTAEATDVAGNVAADVTTNELLISYNDLAVAMGSLYTLPMSIVSGKPLSGTVSVVVQNLGNVALSAGQTATVQLLARNSSNVDTIIGSTTAYLSSLAVSGSVTANVSVNLLTGLPVENYTVFARITPSPSLAESSTSNNEVFSGKTIVVASPFVDLIGAIGATTLPTKLIASGDGTVISLPVIITNQGNVALPSNTTNISVAVAARPYGTTGASDVSLKIYSVYVGALGAGVSTTAYLSVTLPTGMPTSTYYLVAKVDSANQIAETNPAAQAELNNEAQTASTINVKTGFVDLAGTFGSSYTLPSSAVAGKPVSGYVSVNVQNLGNVALPSTQSVTVQLYARNSSNVDTLISPTPATLFVGGLAAGGSVLANVYANIPGGLSTDTYSIVARITPVQSLTEQDTTANNNYVTSPAKTLVVASPFVDLIGAINNPTLPTRQIASGDGTIMTLPLTITNSGNVALPSNTTSISVAVAARPYGTTGASDVLLKTYSVYVGALGAGVSTTAYLSVTLPTGMPTSTYNLVAKIDSANQVAETNPGGTGETNNEAVTAATINVKTGYVDLAGVFGTYNTLPSAAVSNKPIAGTVAVSVQNRGNVALPAGQTVTVQLFARNSSNVDTPISAASTVYVSALAPNASVLTNVYASVSSGLAADTYAIVAKITPVQSLAEQDATPGNNYITLPSRTLTVAAPYVDLVGGFGASMSLPASAVSGSGAIITVPVTVQNAGNVAVPAGSVIDLTISAVTSGQSPVLLKTISNLGVGYLAPGSVMNISAYVTLPQSMVGGAYNLVVNVDSTGKVAETNPAGTGETNNITSSIAAINVAQGFQDISLSLNMQAYSFPYAAFSGKAVSGMIPVVVKNTGNLATPAGQTISLRVVAEDNAQTPSVSVTLANVSSLYVGYLAPGASTTLYAYVNQTAGFTTGDYFIRAYVTNLNGLADTTTLNNDTSYTAAAPDIMVTPTPFVDLVTGFAASLNVPSTTTMGNATTFYVPVTVRNEGNVAVPAGTGSVDISIYVRPTSGPDVLLKTMTGQYVGGLAPNASQTFTATVTLPSNLADGTYSLVAVVDQANKVVESSKTNNTAVSAVTINVALPKTFNTNSADFSGVQFLHAAPGTQRTYVGQGAYVGTSYTESFTAEQVLGVTCLKYSQSSIGGETASVAREGTVLWLARDSAGGLWVLRWTLADGTVLFNAKTVQDALAFSNAPSVLLRLIAGAATAGTVLTNPNGNTQEVVSVTATLPQYPGMQFVKVRKDCGNGDIDWVYYNSSVGVVLNLWEDSGDVTGAGWALSGF